MGNPNFSCKTCTKRYPGCHPKCEIYLKEKEEYNIREKEIEHRAKMNREFDRYSKSRRFCIQR